MGIEELEIQNHYQSSLMGNLDFSMKEVAQYALQLAMIKIRNSWLHIDQSVHGTSEVFAFLLSTRACLSENVFHSIWD